MKVMTSPIKSIHGMFKKQKKKKKWHRKCSYFYSKAVLDEKKIIFSCFFGRQYSDSPKALYLQMLNDPYFKDYTFVWSFVDVQAHADILDFQDHRTVLVKNNTDAFLEHLYSAKYWVFNFKTTSTYRKRKDQVFIQCWHGTPLKKLGRDIAVAGNAATNLKDIHRSYLIESKKYDYFISPSGYATDKFISSFGLDVLGKRDIVLELGYPRNDSLVSTNPDEISEIKLKLGIPLDRKVLLYCPTFRDNQYTAGVGHTFELGLNLLRLKETLGDKYVILLRLHYLVANRLDFGQFTNFVYDLSKYDDVNDLYKVSDILITDYSSVFFDYAILRKPIIFYMYDFEEYQSQLRDFYLGLEDLPGEIFYDQVSLIERLDSSNITNIDSQQFDAFIDKYCYLEDGNAADRVITEVFKNETIK